MYISVKSNAQRNKKCKENPDPKWNPGNDDFRAKPHPPKLPICKKESTKSLRRKGNNQHQKGIADVAEQGAIFQLQQAAEFGSFYHMALALESRIQERGYSIFLDN